MIKINWRKAPFGYPDRECLSKKEEVTSKMRPKGQEGGSLDELGHGTEDV